MKSLGPEDIRRTVMAKARDPLNLRWLILAICLTTSAAVAEDNPDPQPTLNELKVAGAKRSTYLKQRPARTSTDTPTADLSTFRSDIQPILKETCVDCHGADLQEGNIRIDTLDPDLFHGKDVDWWLEVLAVLSNGEMPPPDDADLPDEDRAEIVEWLSKEIQLASTVRRAEGGHSSFRRLTRYEYRYALQDLLGLPFDFAKDLPPESNSEDGFQNSSENLHMSAMQFGTYRELSRSALQRATVRGDRPEPIYWCVSMKAAAERAWRKQDEKLKEIKEKHKDDPEKLAEELARQEKSFKNKPGGTHVKDLTNGRMASVSWGYHGAKYAWDPSDELAPVPQEVDHVAIIPNRQKLIVELGDRIPDEGNLRIRIRASRSQTSVDENHRTPSLKLEFGWQASNDSRGSSRIGGQDVPIEATPDNPQFYQWDAPLSEIYPRNNVRKLSEMGDLPSPSEFIRLVNNSASKSEIQIDYVEVTAPTYDQWPPESHERIFPNRENETDETEYAREVLSKFMSRAWRHKVTQGEVDQKLKLFNAIRPTCKDSQEAIIEVLATVLSSPKFLYLANATSTKPRARNLDDHELATRLSMFLWCSVPDKELLELAGQERLNDSKVLAEQVKRMLADSRARRFSEQYARQWLGLQLLDYLDVDRKAYPRFQDLVKEAMQEEPIALFHEVLQNNHSVLDFVHADYAMLNEHLAVHYGLNNGPNKVHGNHFRRVQLESNQIRGGLLTLGGLLAMNSDGKDSHPLKRGIWMLERLLNDPPPPPPPAVPEIDLADPEIAKLTLKERIEDHRNQAACMSCHAKIDPWGIAFENFDAVGNWRTKVNDKPIDASSRLFNGQELNGMDGLKRFLLENRQDQFVRAMVHKMTTYALGRPLTFGDRSSIDLVTTDVRKQGDGLATMVEAIVTSDLFRSK